MYSIVYLSLLDQKIPSIDQNKRVPHCLSRIDEVSWDFQSNVLASALLHSPQSSCQRVRLHHLGNSTTYKEKGGGKMITGVYTQDTLMAWNMDRLTWHLRFY